MGLRALALLATAATAGAQLPDGYYVAGAFGPQQGQVGLFALHPRKPGAPIKITNIQGDLGITGPSCVLYRTSDEALIVGERTPTGSSVDVHAIFLDGLDVRYDASFSVGTGGPCCGEIPQMGLLADGRVVVAATDLSAGPLKNYQTRNDGWQGVGIVDTKSGLISPIAITNGAQIANVFNGLAVSPDQQSVYLGTFVTFSQGDIWRVPIAGGTAVKVASVSGGLSNLAFDETGKLWVATLSPLSALFRVDVTSGNVTQVAQQNGALNGLSFEPGTGNFAAVSSAGGNPSNAIFWMQKNGSHTALSSPGFATMSGIAVQPNPELFGRATPGQNASYRWQMPNPGGLPTLGNNQFSLTVAATGTAQPGWVALSTRATRQPVRVLGAEIHLDLTKVFATFPLPMSGPRTLALPIPNNPALFNIPLFAQSLHANGTGLAATGGLSFSAL